MAPADDLTDDASGYKIVENGMLNARISEARSLVDRVVELLKTEDLRKAVTDGGDDPDEVLGRFDWL